MHELRSIKTTEALIKKYEYLWHFNQGFNEVLIQKDSFNNWLNLIQLIEDLNRTIKSINLNNSDKDVDPEETNRQRERIRAYILKVWEYDLFVEKQK